MLTHYKADEPGALRHVTKKSLHSPEGISVNGTPPAKGLINSGGIHGISPEALAPFSREHQAITENPLYRGARWQNPNLKMGSIDIADIEVFRIRNRRGIPNEMS